MAVLLLAFKSLFDCIVVDTLLLVVLEILRLIRSDAFRSVDNDERRRPGSSLLEAVATTAALPIRPSDVRLTSQADGCCSDCRDFLLVVAVVFVVISLVLRFCCMDDERMGSASVEWTGTPRDACRV